MSVDDDFYNALDPIQKQRVTDVAHYRAFRALTQAGRHFEAARVLQNAGSASIERGRQIDKAPPPEAA